jgi:hypothetical protein
MSVAAPADFTLQDYAKFELPYLTLQHGDFHSDNILCVNTPRGWQLSFIDFANTGKQPVALDHAVLEVALRYQFLRFLANEGFGDDAVTMSTLSHQLEVLWMHTLLSPSEQVNDVNFNCGAISEHVNRVRLFVGHVRRNYSARFLTQREGKSGSEFGSVDFLHQYLISISVASLSAIALPMPSTVVDPHIRWMAQSAGVALASYNTLKRADGLSDKELHAGLLWERYIGRRSNTDKR